ncbi:ABC transporter ATP-binding protein [Mycolicibacterium brumae]|uniref:ABC transporter ATP-binding protein n=1 Tax=Mycolicibacterium brumae TaxID=85968 RepID=A0A2G5PFX2_9MYCO|nr:ABC transporter ATP-binding protein [Mycolicibacterium brumae]MCV7191633.1 ABC transporter ATP-binding protein [Mycolicibacterium brumae]PIB76933.1 ABC transporter ATP-binding protein [Mycolicibacterium brumae]RWA20511.1 hypothetical protein MBRU_02310 [Mycolicibacterium brumae DSM 44177]UWW07611.1 ABC transporter ATP-binding protein [Mycolicibacterium brumae]
MTFQAAGLRRAFGSQVAVAQADLTLTPGRVTGLVGPNGAGKTTLLLMLAGLLAPDQGAIRYQGRDLAPQRLRSLVGWMPDTIGVWETLTAAEILTAFARLHQLPTPTARQRVAELLDLVHLREFANTAAHELSRGQKQRLSFARALIQRPAVLLLDEPASGMDPRSRLDLRDQLRELADGGAAVLVSSHILSELSEMVDDVVVMAAGRTTEPLAATGNLWRIRPAGQPSAAAEVRSFPDDASAAAYLATLIAGGTLVAEFARAGNDLEALYLASIEERV